MGWVVVSESVRQVLRDASYSNTPGPSIPGGVMHGTALDTGSTVCGVAIESLHVWPHLSFPRTYGSHCPDCVDVSERAVDLTSVGATSEV